MKKSILSFLILTGFILMVPIFGCNSSSTPVGPGPGGIKYVSATVCSSCHLSKGESWETTAHFRALDDLLASDHAAEYCFPCHTTGLDDNAANSGYDDPNPDVAAKFGGVQCEACHGAGSDHIVTKIPLGRPVSAEPCYDCHTGAHNPFYEDWANSAHAVSLEEPREESSYFAGNLCLSCHSADYMFAVSVPEDADAFDFEYGVTCVVCHEMHGATNEYQLRMPVDELCRSCHTAEEALPGQNPHHPQGDIYDGEGAYEYPDKTYDVLSGHNVSEEACASCHMWTSPFNATGQGEPAYSGHTFKPMIEACQECHVEATSFDRNGFQTKIQDLLLDLKAELDAATDNDKLTLSYERANFNYRFINGDGSLGMHNPLYVEQILEDSIEAFEPGS